MTTQRTASTLNLVSPFDSPLQFLHQWQTLRGSTLALLAGIATVYVIYKQLRFQRHEFEIEKSRHDRSVESKAFAAKAELPDSLSALCNYTDICASYVLNPKHTLFPPPPTAHIKHFKDAIEHLEPQIAEFIFEIVAFYQVHNARLSDYPNPNAVLQFEQQLYDTTYLRAKLHRLFPFARNRSSTVDTNPITVDEMESALNQIIGLRYRLSNEEQFSDVRELFRKRHPTQDPTKT
jgi:hypothetical protein